MPTNTIIRRPDCDREHERPSQSAQVVREYPPVSSHRRTGSGRSANGTSTRAGGDTTDMCTTTQSISLTYQGRSPLWWLLYKWVETARLILALLGVNPESGLSGKPPQNPKPVPVEPTPTLANPTVPPNPTGPPPNGPNSPKIPPGQSCVQRIIKGCEQGCSTAVCELLCVVACTSIAVTDETLGSGGYCP